MTTNIWHCKTSKDFLQRYEEIRGGREVIDRQDFTPRSFQPWLSQLLIVTVAPDGELTVHLAGTEIVDRVGYEISGKQIKGYFNGKSGGRFGELIQEAVRNAHGCRGVGNISTLIDGVWDLELTFVPFRQDKTGEIRLLGYIAGSCRQMEDYGIEVKPDSLSIHYVEKLAA